jgi:hypothetical protein
VDQYEDPLLAEEERVCLDFETANEERRVQLLVQELKPLIDHCQFQTRVSTDGNPSLKAVSSSLFTSEAILPELLCLLPITLAHCPDLLSPVAVCRALLSTAHAAPLVTAVVANIPWCFHPVVDMLAQVATAGEGTWGVTRGSRGVHKGVIMG